jgi:hypothetical protein
LASKIVSETGDNMWPESGAYTTVPRGTRDTVRSARRKGLKHKFTFVILKWDSKKPIIYLGEQALGIHWIITLFLFLFFFFF